MVVNMAVVLNLETVSVLLVTKETFVISRCVMVGVVMGRVQTLVSAVVLKGLEEDTAMKSFAEKDVSMAVVPNLETVSVFLVTKETSVINRCVMIGVVMEHVLSLVFAVVMMGTREGFVTKLFARMVVFTATVPHPRNVYVTQDTRESFVKMLLMSAQTLTSVPMEVAVHPVEVLVSLSAPVQVGTRERGARSWWTTVSVESASMEESVLMLTTASVVDVLKGLLESCVGSTLTTVPLSLATTTGFVETRLQTMSVHALTKLMVANLQRTAAVLRVHTSYAKTTELVLIAKGLESAHVHLVSVVSIVRALPQMTLQMRDLVQWCTFSLALASGWLLPV
jgi:hypothetical protein